MPEVKGSPEFVLLAFDENGLATFHDIRTDTYFEARVLGDVLGDPIAALSLPQGLQPINES